MILIVREGEPIVVLVCPECTHSVLVRWPEQWARCPRCEARVDVPDAERTQPA